MKWLALWYLLASIATFVAFGIDKSRARRGEWRTPERTLHAFSLAGGFPGVYVAMLILRHKNRKPLFWIVASVAALVHAALLAFALLRLS